MTDDITYEPTRDQWEEWERLCRNAEAERDEALAEAEGRIADLECRAKRAESDLADMTRQRDEWKSRHAALRADVDEFQYKHREYPSTWELVDALGRDDKRGEQA